MLADKPGDLEAALHLGLSAVASSTAKLNYLQSLCFLLGASTNEVIQIMHFVNSGLEPLLFYCPSTYELLVITWASLQEQPQTAAPNATSSEPSLSADCISATDDPAKLNKFNK